MKDMATIQDLDSYKEVFAKWESYLHALKVLKLNPSNLTQESRYHTQDFAKRVSVLQHEWIQSTLYILVKHNHKFMEGLGKYAKVQALRATNWSGECIFF